MSRLFKSVRPVYYPGFEEMNNVRAVKSTVPIEYLHNSKENSYEYTFKDGSKQFVTVRVKYLDLGRKLKHLSWLRAIKTTAIVTLKNVNGKWIHESKVESTFIDNDEAYIENMSDKEFDDWCNEQYWQEKADEAAEQSSNASTWSDYDYDYDDDEYYD